MKTDVIQVIKDKLEELKEKREKLFNTKASCTGVGCMAMSNAIQNDIATTTIKIEILEWVITVNDQPESIK